MDYIGMDYCVDLACSGCAGTTRVRYSSLLTLLDVGGAVACAACGRTTNHNWATASKAQQLFREHFERTRLMLETVYRPPRATA
jgi:hypothetical protein